MVVMLVIVMASGGALTAYLKFNEKQAISSDARQFVGEISRARSLASSLQYPAGCVGFRGVNVKSDTSRSGLIVTTQCNSGNFSETKANFLLVSTFTAAFDITFLPGSGYLSTGSNQTIVISDNRTTPNTISITVGNYGKVNVL